MIKEVFSVLGYHCDGCGRVFEFPFDAYSHRCFGATDYNLRAVGQKQMAQLQLHTFKPDGTHEGIALSEKSPIVVAKDMVELRREVRRMIGTFN